MTRKLVEEYQKWTRNKYVEDRIHEHWWEAAGPHPHARGWTTNKTL